MTSLFEFLTQPGDFRILRGLTLCFRGKGNKTKAADTNTKVRLIARRRLIAPPSTFAAIYSTLGRA
jgi:hypothetical protein